MSVVVVAGYGGRPHNLLEVLLLRLSSVLLCQVLSGLAHIRLDGLYCILP